LGPVFSERVPLFLMTREKVVCCRSRKIRFTFSFLTGIGLILFCARHGFQGFHHFCSIFFLLPIHILFSSFLSVVVVVLMVVFVAFKRFGVCVAVGGTF
jgi:hypothetical protein